MKHLFLCREYPPAPYPAGGIGTYVSHITRLLAESGETVHLIGQRWEGASERTERQCDGRLIIHRIAAEDRELYPSLMPPEIAVREVKAMQASAFPAQWFSWVAAGLAEQLIEADGIDVIEGQEWEAPLYYFMLRRSLGLGPALKPPVIVHLHSPTEFIFRSNDWSTARRDYLPMKRLEDQVILGADALLCPSRFLAAQSRAKYGLAEEAVTTIPLPLGGTKRIERATSVWEYGTVCYFGRLEPRKGVIEFVDAAIEVAYERPEVRFVFIGADTPFNDAVGVLQYVQQRIPQALRERFVFHGARPRAELLSMLGEARIAVVPSRWENFPNTALEAMCTGLPVLATRSGGMAEMIADGENGWLAADGPGPLATRLAEALRRALDTSPEQMQTMGGRACTAIRKICENDAIVARHLVFRNRCVTAGASRSLTPPKNLPWSESSRRPIVAQTSGTESGPMVVVVVALAGEDPSPTLESLQQQSMPHTTILVAGDPTADTRVAFIPYHGSSTAVARRLALDANELESARAVMFVRAGTHLQTEALARMASVLDHRLEAGIVAPWTDANSTLIGETPAFPYQWLSDGTGWSCLYRMAAVRDALALDPRAADAWELGTAIMAAGWTALRLPALLATNDVQSSDVRDIGWRRRALAERHAVLIAQDAATLVGLELAANSPPAEVRREQVDSLSAVLQMPVREQLTAMLAAVRQPRRSLSWLAWRLRSGLARLHFGRRS